MLTNKRGEILAVTMGLSIVFILLGYYAIYFSTVKRESFEKENMLMRAFWLAEAGRTAANAELIYLFRPGGILQTTGVPVADLDNYVLNGNALGLLTGHCGFVLNTVDMDNNPNTPSVSAASRTFTPTLAFNFGLDTTPATYNATVSIIPTPGVSPNPSFAGGVYTFHYQYIIDSIGSVVGNSALNKRVWVEGKRYLPTTNDHFIVTLTPGFSYAKFNYFASNHWADHWLVEGMNFNGPVHANNNLSFANNPSIPTPTSGQFKGYCGPYFFDTVTSADKEYDYTDKVWEGRSFFYNGGHSNSLLLADYQNTRTTPPNVPDIPYYAKGLTYMVEPIGLDFDPVDHMIKDPQKCLFRTSTSRTTTQTEEMTKMKNYALGGLVGNEPTSPGVYLPLTNNKVNGGVFISTASAITMNKDASQNPTYDIAMSGCTKKVTINYNANTTTISDTGSACVNAGTAAGTYSGIPNGSNKEGIIIYDKGGISLSGLVQKDTAVTVVAEDQVFIKNNINYEVDPSIPGNENAKNLLGVVSWAYCQDSEIQNIVSISITDNVTPIRIDGILMAPGGSISAYNWTNRKLGDITVFGGLIQEHSDPFGWFDWTNGIARFSGYSTYDKRMANGLAPPYFPKAVALLVDQSGLDTKPKWSGE